MEFASLMVPALTCGLHLIGRVHLSRLKTVIIAPMTSTIKDNFPTRVMTLFKERQGQIALDQLRVIDRSLIVQKLGVIEKETQMNVLNILGILFQK